jgi:hypothetical protein
MNRNTPYPATFVAVLATVTTLAACSETVPTATPAVRGAIPPSHVAPLLAAAGSQTRDVVPNGNRLGILGDATPLARTRYRSEYHGGRVLEGAAHVYLIYYGTWAQSDKNIIGTFVGWLGLSPYFSISSLYPVATGVAPSGSVVYAGAVSDDYSHGTTIGDADVVNVVHKPFVDGQLPVDPAGIYVVLTSPDVDLGSGLGSAYCAFHGRSTFMSAPARYVVVGSPERSPTRCAPQAVGPNGTLGADATVSLLAAELFNTVTDPDLTAWYDKLGLEGADKCAWTYGTTYKAANGALANVRLAGVDYLLQQLWMPSKNGGTCALSI